MMRKFKPVVLVIVDGWGVSGAWGGNAITMNSPNFINGLWRQYPHTILRIFESEEGERKRMGSSEVGHASLGAGRIVRDDYMDINNLIESGDFYNNNVLIGACNRVNKCDSVLHLVGLLSTGGVHGHIKHIEAMIELARRQKVKRLAIHLITDGRDDEPEAGLELTAKIEEIIKEKSVGVVVSICGSYYALVNNDSWNRIGAAYRAEALGDAFEAESANETIKAAYSKGYNDEILPPVVIKPQKKNPVVDGKELFPVKSEDAVVFAIFRRSNIKRLASLYLDNKLVRKSGWHRLPVVRPVVVTLTDYHLEDAFVAFPPDEIGQTISEIISRAGLKQLHISESEKEEHITYYFNGGREKPFVGEDRMIIPSPKVTSYVKCPEMNVAELTKKIRGAILDKKYDFIVANIPNLDILAHTGNIVATNQAVLKVDEAIKSIVEAAIKVDGAIFLTSDHGSAEQMVYTEKLHPDTRHTANPVPFIYINGENHRDLWQSAVKSPVSLPPNTTWPSYSIADVAPTILELMELEKPEIMTGESLLDQLS